MISIEKELSNQGTITDVLIKIANKASDSDLSDVAPKEEFELLASAGLLKIVLPGEKLDFNGPHTAELLQLLKSVGKANLSIGRIYEGHINALYLIHLFGSDKQKVNWYDAVRTQNALFGVWNTQTANGVTIVSTSNGFVVNGKKTFCSGAEIVTHPLITGNIDSIDRKGWQMMVLEMDKIGYEKIDKSSWKTLGMRASGSFIVDFSGYSISEGSLLAMPGNYLKQPYFNGGAIRFAAVQLGGVEAIADETLSYLKLLNRTEDSLQNTRISNIMTAVTSGNLWINQAGENFENWVDKPDRSEELIVFANMTRTAIEEIGVLVMQESNKCVGARGLMYPFPFERFYRDLSFYLRQPAPDATKLDIAKHFFKTRDD